MPTKTHFLEITKYPQTQMAQISVSLSDDLVAYLDRKVENPSILIESLLQQWQEQQEKQALAEACQLVDELNLGWDEEWQTQAITDWEASDNRNRNTHNAPCLGHFWYGV